MSTDPIVRESKTPLSHTKVLWSQTALLAAFLDRAKEAQREAMRKDQEHVAIIEQEKLKGKKYRVYLKMMSRGVFANSGDPLRQSPLTSLEITENKEFKEIVRTMGYDRRVMLLFAKACEEKLRDVDVKLSSLQEVIIRFIRMRPLKYIRMGPPKR